MAGKITHALIFIFMATLVTASIVNIEPNDNAKLALQLPVMILAGLYVGVLFVLYVLPTITDKATSAVLSSNERVKHEPLQDAQAAHARGDYEAAIEIYRSIAENEPLNRLPWVEIAKIEHDQLKDPEASIHTLRSALEEHEWPADDTAFFMVRMADIELEDMENPEKYAAILNEIVEIFPETRHSANAIHKLKEMDHL